MSDKISLEISGESTCLNDTNIRDLIAENEALKAEKEKLTRNLFEKDFEVAVLEGNYEELQAFKDQLKDEVENLKGLLDHRDEIARS